MAIRLGLLQRPEAHFLHYRISLQGSLSGGKFLLQERRLCGVMEKGPVGALGSPLGHQDDNTFTTRDEGHLNTQEGRKATPGEVQVKNVCPPPGTGQPGEEWS